MSMLLAHKLATGRSARVLEILDNLILLLIPSANPDGLIDVKKWYEGTLGESYEGVMPPFLYQHYTGHDNNRDWFMFTQQETRLVVEHCFNAWRPHVVLDMHQTRSNGVRMMVPPFVDPMGAECGCDSERGEFDAGRGYGSRPGFRGQGGGVDECGV